MGKLFTVGQPYSERGLYNCMEAMEEIAVKDLGLSIFPNQFKIVPERGMLDAYAQSGMPTLYPHWSFGKEWKRLELLTKNGQMGLAYEMVVPTNPCISWNSASNDMSTMAIVMAHAAFGHNHVFKNNHVFQKHTHYEALADYCFNARDTILKFEERYGANEVESVLDAAHALELPGGIFRDKEPEPFDIEREKRRLAAHMRSIEEGVDLQMLATVPGLASRYVERPELGEDVPRLPEENILYFVEKHSPRLQPWQREVIRIVRTLAQQTAFPSVQTKVLNEGAAMFVEKYIFYKLYDKGLIDEGSMMEYARLNAGVLYQPELAEIEKERAKTKNPKPINLLGLHFNPYALGLAICEEIVRISGPRGDDAKFFEGWIKGGPTREDKQWFPWAGDGNWRERLRDAWANYRDDSFIEQFLSPSIMRRWKMFSLTDMGEEFAVTQTIHENAVETTGFEEIRSLLAQAHSFDAYFPQVAVIEADLLDERELVIQVTPHNGMELEDKSAEATLEHLETLWGYEVSMADPAE